MFNPKWNMFFLRNYIRNDKQPLSNFEAEIAVEAKQLEAQPKKVVAYKTSIIRIRDSDLPPHARH